MSPNSRVINLHITSFSVSWTSKYILEKWDDDDDDDDDDYDEADKSKNPVKLHFLSGHPFKRNDRRCFWNWVTHGGPIIADVKGNVDMFVNDNKCMGRVKVNMFYKFLQTLGFPQKFNIDTKNGHI